MISGISQVLRTGLVGLLILTACNTPKGVTRADKQGHVLKMSSETLAKLHAQKPETKAMIKKAAGYGVFSSIGTHVFVLAGGSGYGVVVDNATGKRTFMKMRSVGFGLGMGVKDFRAVFIFKNKRALQDFVEKGWEFGGQADAAAKSGDKGDAVAGEAYLESEIAVYQITEAGLALQATVAGTKYWRDKDTD